MKFVDLFKTKPKELEKMPENGVLNKNTKTVLSRNSKNTKLTKNSKK